VPASSQFTNESVDIAYLDADHTRAAEDIRAWWPKIKPGGWLCGHDYAQTQWITVKAAVDDWVQRDGLRLYVTQEKWPSWAVRKSLPGENSRGERPPNPVADVTLLMAVYEPYAHMLPSAIVCLVQHWPGRPEFLLDASTMPAVHSRLEMLCMQAKTEFVVTMHEDFRLCQPVKQQQFLECLETMRRDPGLVSCSLTWEPSNTGCYGFPLAPYSDNFRALPWSWAYTCNLQMRIWRREMLRAILHSMPADTTNSTLEPRMTESARVMFPNGRCITYNFPEPPRPSTFVDDTDKSAWIIGYDNIVHAGRLRFEYPVIIINRDRYTSTRRLVEYLLEYTPEAIPIILDNASTYPPLLEWYKKLPQGVRLVRLRENIGSKAPWIAMTPEAREMGHPYYCVTDSDLDLTAVPPDVMGVLRRGLEQYPAKVKAGLSLRLDDLPSTPLAKRAYDWEHPHFWNPADRVGDWYACGIDTTFAMYRAGDAWGATKIRSALRHVPPYTARHLPWYVTEPCSAEEAYYREHADYRWATWVRWGRETGA
jgi:hypothetical protein